ncbi:MAG: hypothetical protein M3Y30_14515 [Gemmatimonadota bacterium]|nr:hypothetical protein [Gemmatimonadota bacterium]
MKKTVFMALATVFATVACSDSSPTGQGGVPLQSRVLKSSGDIADSVSAFRTLIGPSNGAAPGAQPGGRREINWDGAGANAFDNQNNFPPDFFNTTVKVGAVFTTDGTGFRNDSTSFAEIDPTYAGQFSFFSPNKIFSPVGGNVLDVIFEVAGQPTPAVSSGLGIVFSDVDVAGSTTVELFAQDGTSLGIFAAPVRSDDKGLSFLGISFDQSVIARARVTLGTGALGVGVKDITDGGTVDLVVIDNLVYGEPKQAF